MGSLQNILLIGSTGTIGTAIRKGLVFHKSKFSKVGVLTAAASLADEKKKAIFDTLHGEGLEIVVSDLDDKESLVKALKGWDTVICALAPLAVPKQKTVIDAAVEAGVSRFLPSEFGFDLSTPFNSIQPAYKGKVAIEEHLKEVALNNPSFSYTFISNGSFADFIFQVPPIVFELDPRQHTANIIGDGDVPISFTSYEDVGEFVVAVLQRPGETHNKLVCVQGQLSSWNEIVKILEGLQSRKYTVTYTSIAEVEEKETEAWKKGDPSAARLNLRRCMGTGNAKLDNVDNDLFPEFKATTSLENIARAALTKQGLL